MATFATFFSYTPETWQQMMANPGDRSAPVREFTAKVGAKLEALYFMFGQFDGITIFEAPDSVTAAAISIATTSSGAFSRMETHELIDPAALPDILGNAKAATAEFTPPGA